MKKHPECVVLKLKLAKSNVHGEARCQITIANVWNHGTLIRTKFYIFYLFSIRELRWHRKNDFLDFHYAQQRTTPDGGVTLSIQQLFDPVDGFLPAHMLLDCQAFKGLDRGLGRALRL